jgi:tetratricopeptide (TPR) repeat protein
MNRLCFFLVFPLFLLLLLPDRALAQMADEVNTLRLAQTYEQGGKHEEALRYFQSLLAARPANDVYFDGVRRCLTALKRYDEALQALDERIRLYPNNENLYVFRGGIHVLNNQADNAHADWKHAISINPANAQVYGRIADQCVNARLYDDAVRYLREARKALNSPQLFTFEIARACAMNMNIDCTMDEYLQYLRTVPQALYQIQQHIGMFSDIPDALETAVQRSRAAIGKHPDDVTIRFLLSWLYQERKDYIAAFEIVRDIERLNNSGGMELLRFAGRAYDDGAFKAAADAYRHIISTYRDANFIPQAEFQYARCVEAMQDAQTLPAELLPAGSGRSPGSEAFASYQGAITLYEEIARKYAGQPIASESLYRIGYIKFRHFGDSDGALEMLRSISTARRNVYGKSDADILIGDILVAKGDIDNALAQYTSVLSVTQLDKRDRNKVWFKIAELHYFSGDFDTALVELKQLTEDVYSDIANDALELSAIIHQYRQPGEAPLRRYAAALFSERQGKLSEAEAQLQDIIASHRSHDVVDLAYLKRARILRTMQRPRDAAAAYRSFIEQRPDTFLRDRGLFFLAEVSEYDLDDSVTAMTLYQQLLEQYPYSQFAPQARDNIVRLRRGQS